MHVTEGGGSFGRQLFADAAFEAAGVSKALGKPVKLMWHRTDEPRRAACTRWRPRGCGRPTSAGSVLAFDQRHTSVATDFTHGLGEVLTARWRRCRRSEPRLLADGLHLTQNVPYDFGVVTQLLNEIYESTRSTPAASATSTAPT